MDNLRIYGIIGNPVRRSLSPLIHNFLFKKYKIKAIYQSFEIEENKLRQVLQSIRVLGIKGVNVTAPYKVKVIPLLDEIKTEANAIGAVNTVQNLKGDLIGYNTDGYGIEQTLDEGLKFSPRNKTIVILGAGGAAQACLHILLKSNPKEILIFNRTLEKAEQLKERFSKESNHTNISVCKLENLQDLLADEKIDLIINATSGNNSIIEESISKFLNESESRIKIFDLNYNSTNKTQNSERETKFIDGTYMLVAQALESFCIWTGIKPEFEPVLQLVSKHIKRGNYA